MLYLLRTHSCLLYSFSSWGYSTVAQFLPTRGSSPGATRSTRTSRRSSPSRHPCGAQLPRDYIYVLCFRILYIRHFVINVINNIRIRFIISFMWYVLWYTVHSVVYTCDLILARIWLLGLCSFINRVLQSQGVHPELPGVRWLLGVRLPVDVPVAPCFRETSYMYSTLPLYQTFCH